MGGGCERPRGIASVTKRRLFAELYAAIAPGDSRVREACGHACDIMATALGVREASPIALRAVQILSIGVFRTYRMPLSQPSFSFV